eukprot:11211706-Lingulodinium_polyedra.AAC.1
MMLPFLDVKVECLDEDPMWRRFYAQLWPVVFAPKRLPPGGGASRGCRAASRETTPTPTPIGAASS